MFKRLSILLLILMLALAACGGDAAAPTEEPEIVVEDVVVEDPIEEEESPTDEPEPEAEAVPEPTAEPELEPTDEPMEEPTTEPEPEPTDEPVEELMVEAPTMNMSDGCVTDYQEGVDYFPEKAITSYTDGFTIDYFDHYKVVTVPIPFSGAEVAETYVLVQCGTPIPEGFEGETIVEVPINRFVSMSTTYLPHLDQIGAIDTLVGVDSAGFISNETARAKFDAGELAEIGFGAEVNTEVVLDLEPDLVMTFASGSPDFDAHPKLREAGIPVAISADFLDTSPLGNAEWGKFIAVFFNKEAAATAQFDTVVSEYEGLADMIANNATSSPTVFSESPFDGTWFAPGGASYAAQLFADAGATYVFADDETAGSLFLDFETVFEAAADADYWLNIGFFGSLDDLAAADERFTEFAAYQNGNVYNNDLRTNELGANDYFESGTANPHLVLADLAKIFHPELMEDHEFVYYRPVE